MRGLSFIATGFACAAGAAFCAGVSVQGDVFGGSSKGGAASVAHVRLDLRALDSTCIHGTRDWVDFEPVFTPAVEGLVLSESMLQGFALNSNGMLRLSLNGSSFASGSVTVGAPPLSWGSLGAEASIHRCEGGAQEMCWACGRLHGTGDDVVCSHGRDCAACRDREADCTCSPIFVRVNWDDDDWDGDADREASAPMTDDDELVSYRALGVTRSCWCHTDWQDGSSVSGLAASSELRLWSGSVPASSGSDAFEIEAVSATEGIGTGSVRYDVCDATNGLLRTVVRSVTAANIEMRPDWDDSGDIDGSDRYWQHPDVRPSRWQIRVRETPYLLRLASECPVSAALDLDAVCTEGVAPSLRSADTGASLAAVRRNALQDVLVDTSAGAGDMELTYSLGVTDGRAELTDTLVVHVVDTSVEEKWIPAGSVSGASYDYSDVDGYVDWWVWRETDEGDEYVDGGYGPVFTLAGLEAGDYHVGVYFDDIFEDGWWGYSSYGDLHVVDVRLDRLYETANPANRIFNPTRKDDTSGNFIGEKEHAGTELEERYAAPRNYLYVVGDPETGDFNVTAQFAATGAETCTNYYCAFYNGEVKVANSETNIDFAAGAASFSVTAPLGATDVLFQLRGGLDLNGNGVLDESESSPFAVYTNSERRIKLAYVKGITKELYARNCAEKEGEVFFANDNPASIIFPHARTLLTLYYEKGSLDHLNPNLMPSSELSGQIPFDAFSTNCMCFAEWLTHNSGLDFDDEGQAGIMKYVWTADSDMSKFFALRMPFALEISPREQNPLIDDSMPSATCERLWQFYNDNVRSEAETFLATAEDGQEIVLPSATTWYDGSCIFDNLSSNWVPGVTLSVGSSSGYADAYGVVARDLIGNTNEMNEYDAFGTIGRGRVLNPQYRFHVKKDVSLLGLLTRYKVIDVEFSCTLTDLYDFNCEDGGRAAAAAALQVGYGNGASSGYPEHGKIFIHEIRIEKDYEDPFRQYRRQL